MARRPNASMLPLINGRPDSAGPHLIVPAGRPTTIDRNASEIRFDWGRVSGPRQAHLYSTPCRRHSLGRPDGWSRDGGLQGVISNSKMTLGCILLIQFNPQTEKFRSDVRPPEWTSRRPTLVSNLGFRDQTCKVTFKFRAGRPSFTPCRQPLSSQAICRVAGSQ
jgi:hypothetical protein